LGQELRQGALVEGTFVHLFFHSESPLSDDGFSFKTVHFGASDA
jgi:hypothetical protein